MRMYEEQKRKTDNLYNSIKNYYFNGNKELLKNLVSISYEEKPFIYDVPDITLKVQYQNTIYSITIFYYYPDQDIIMISIDDGTPCGTRSNPKTYSLDMVYKYAYKPIVSALNEYSKIVYGFDSEREEQDEIYINLLYSGEYDKIIDNNEFRKFIKNFHIFEFDLQPFGGEIFSIFVNKKVASNKKSILLKYIENNYFNNTKLIEY